MALWEDVGRLVRFFCLSSSEMTVLGMRIPIGGNIDLPCRLRSWI